MKTERVTLLTTPEFKAFLAAEAQREGVSVAELVRTRCEQRDDPDESTLRALARELSRAVAEARQSLRGGIEEADAVLKALRQARQTPVVAAAQPRAKGRAREAA